jgi:hypothetical protein
MSTQHPIRTAQRTLEILFEWLIVLCCKSLAENSLLFDWKTSA